MIMKVLFVIHGLRSGGAERVLTMLSNYLVTVGYDVSILIFTEEEPFYDIHPSIKLIKIEQKVKKKNIFYRIKSLFIRINSIKKVFKDNDPDIIISFITIMNIYSIVAARLAKKNIIVSEHTNYTRYEKSVLGFFRRLIYPLANAVVVLTNYDKNKYSFVKNVNVIKNPLVLSNKYTNIVREKIILGAGSLVELKGFDMLIKAFSKLNKNDWKLIIVGEGPKRKDLESLINKLGLEERISLPGVTKDIEKYYKKASIFVLSSRIEGFPGVLCEAMGYGCPSIAFDCLTGPRDIIEDKISGILVEAENEDQLSNEIQNLIDNKEYRELLGSNSKKILDELDINKIAQKWIRVIEDVNK